MSEGPKVVQVVSSLCIGGAERAALELAAGLCERGFASELWVVAPPASPEEPMAPRAEALADEVARREIPLRRFGLGSIHRRSDRVDRIRLRQALREEKVALLNVHNRPIDWQVVFLARAVGVPALYTRQLGYDDVSTRQRVVYAAAGRAAAAVVALTQAVARHVEEFERVPAHKLWVIPDGVDMARYRPPLPGERARLRAALGIGEGEFVWLCAARLVRQKGLGFLLEALRHQLPRAVPSRLLLAGEGPEEAALRQRCAALGLTDRVQFLGRRDDVPALLRAVDGYACSSLGEGQGLSLVEALAAEVPVVAPRLACVEELGEAGFVRFGPKIEGWAAAHEPEELAAALDAVEAGRAWSEAPQARRFVEARFSTTSMLDGYESLYRRILGPGPGAGSCDIPRV